MIKDSNGLLVAEFNSIAEIETDEVLRADIVSVRGHISGGIYHSNRHIWKGNIAGIAQPLEFYRSKSEKKEFSKVKDIFLKMGYTVKTVEANQQLRKEFTELYEETTAKREHLIAYDLNKGFFQKFPANEQYLCGLFCDGKLESGLAISINGTVCTVSFSAKKRFQHIQSGAGGILEYELLNFCIQQSILEINHGGGNNPIGVYTHIGNFEFKSRYGYSAFPQDYWKTSFFKTTDFLSSDLLFISVDSNILSYFVFAKEITSSLENKYKTKEIENVKVFPLTVLTEQYRAFIQEFC